MGTGELKLNDLLGTQGQVRGSKGLILTAEVPGARRGDWVRILKRADTSVDAEVVAFEGDLVSLMPLGDSRGIGAGDPVVWMGPALSVHASVGGLLGRVVDGIGRPLDGLGPLEGDPWPLWRPSPPALSRPRIQQVLPTGVRALDALCTVGEGQRLAVFAPAGAGKTSLIARLAQGCQVDAIVTCLIGERGRELNEFLEDALDKRTRARSVVVCSTSDASALERTKSAQLATCIAEFLRDQGMRVLLLMDSLTRLVRSAREVGLAAGEPPARRGFPPSAFAELAPLIERAGMSERGSITAFYTVLVEGNDLDEPVADEVRGLVDGHIVLDRALSQRGHYPSIDVVKSLSRSMDSLVSPPHREAARRLRGWLAHFEHKRELFELGAVQPGSDRVLDQVLTRLPAIHALLCQGPREVTPFGDTLDRLFAL
ncbi:MAG: FliI/YscN family ATPase [Myxococcales bacterium]